MKAIKLVKSGDEIVYSTCSILNLENENIINKVKDFVDIIPIEIDKFKSLSILKNNIFGTILICPTSEYEGFFMAKLRKK